MNKPLDTWLDRKGRAVLDEKKRGFFVYEDKGWTAILDFGRLPTEGGY